MKRHHLIIGGLLIAVALLAEERDSTPLPTYTETPSRPAVQVPANPVEPQAQATILDPAFAELENHYATEIAQLVQKMNGLTSEDAEAIQMQIIALKKDLRLARYELALTRVTELGDQEAIARISAQLEELRNPPVLQAVQADRDPLTGEARSGGAK